MTIIFLFFDRIILCRNGLGTGSNVAQWLWSRSDFPWPLPDLWFTSYR